MGSKFVFTAWFGVGTKARGSRATIPPILTGMRLLVVDDNPGAREILTRLLEELGFQVDAVASAREAIAAVRQDSKANGAVFMDWRMPDMDGIEATRVLKAEYKTQRVILVTAFGRDEVRREAERAQADAFLVKPVSPSHIVDAMVALYAEPSAREHVPASPDPWSAPSLEGMRVLLAEDNEINQQIAVELLASAGVHVTVANHGREALEILDTIDPLPHLVLMDVQMPEMDGFEATQAIRANPRFAELPVVAMTAHAMVEERQRCLSAGMVDHVSKPIDPEALFATLRRFYWRTAASRLSRMPSTTADTPPESEGIAKIDGVDVVAGLRRVAGNRTLYKKLLLQLAEHHANAPVEIRNALEKSEGALAERLAHTVKGVAGNVGALEVQKVAGDLEKSLREHADRSVVERALQTFEERLGELVGRILATSSPIKVQPVEPPVAEEIDLEALAPVVKRLVTLLADADTEAGALVEAEKGPLSALLGDQFATFAASIDGFEFDDALERLRNAASSHGLTLD
ncbi:MAG: response regulator [Myxococcales bacterium]